MRYRLLLQLRVRHGFYTSGRCPDCAIEPTAAGRRALAKHRLVLRSKRDGLDVVCPLDADGAPFIPFSDDLSLAFVMTVRNPHFALFTDLEARRGLAAPRYHNGPGAAAGGELTLGDGDEALPHGAFAVIDIGGVAASWVSDGGASFHVPFAAKRTKWVYYLVTTRRNGVGAPRVVHGVTEAPVVFTTERLTEAGEEVLAADEVARELSGRYPDHERYRVVSGEAIPCREAPVQRLGLFLGDDADPLLGTLPNPSLQQHATIRGSAGTPGPALETRYRIMTY